LIQSVSPTQTDSWELDEGDTLWIKMRYEITGNPAENIDTEDNNDAEACA